MSDLGVLFVVKSHVWIQFVRGTTSPGISQNFLPVIEVLVIRNLLLCQNVEKIFCPGPRNRVRTLGS